MPIMHVLLLLADDEEDDDPLEVDVVGRETDMSNGCVGCRVRATFFEQKYIKAWKNINFEAREH